MSVNDLKNLILSILPDNVIRLISPLRARTAFDEVIDFFFGITGDKDDLNTSNKDTLVDAINESNKVRFFSGNQDEEPLVANPSQSIIYVNFLTGEVWTWTGIEFVKASVTIDLSSLMTVNSTNNVTLGWELTNGTHTLTFEDLVNATEIVVPTKVSELDNDSGYITNVETEDTNDIEFTGDGTTANPLEAEIKNKIPYKAIDTSTTPPDLAQLTAHGTDRVDFPNLDRIYYLNGAKWTYVETNDIV